IYGHLHEGIPVEVLTWRSTARGTLAAVRIQKATTSATDRTSARRHGRHVFWPDSNAFTLTPVYDRYRLAAGATVSGPAVVEEHESTLLIPPGWTGEVDAYRNMIVRLDSEQDVTTAGARLRGRGNNDER